MLVTIYLLARLIAGEAGTCDIDAKLAIAHVHNNRAQANIIGGWYGDAEPTRIDLLIAKYWALYPDSTEGALFLFSNTDLTNRAVRDIIDVMKLQESARFICANSTLHAYK